MNIEEPKVNGVYRVTLQSRRAGDSATYRALWTRGNKGPYSGGPWSLATSAIGSAWSGMDPKRIVAIELVEP